MDPVKIIVTKPTGEEQGNLTDGAKVDIDIGNKCDFEIEIDSSEWNEERYGYGCRFFIPDTEYGGIIKGIKSVSKTEKLTLSGYTWRGMLIYKIVEPPAGQDHLILSGDINEIITQLVGDSFGSLFVVTSSKTGIEVSNWKVDRYVTLYDAIQKLLDQYAYRLNIKYIQPSGLDYGYVKLEAVPIKDYSEELEYSRESKADITVEDYRAGVNHLVCVGEGENQDRIVLHLYAQEDGSIGKNQYYYGVDEIAAVYDYSSADREKLEEGGIKRLQELQNHKKCDINIEDIDLELGDIVAGYDEITDTEVKKPIIQKIFKVEKGEATVDYKMKGDD